MCNLFGVKLSLLTFEQISYRIYMKFILYKKELLSDFGQIYSSLLFIKLKCGFRNATNDDVQMTSYYIEDLTRVVISYEIY